MRVAFLTADDQSRRAVSEMSFRGVAGIVAPEFISLGSSQARTMRRLQILKEETDESIRVLSNTRYCCRTSGADRLQYHDDGNASSRERSGNTHDESGSRDTRPGFGRRD